MDLVKNQMNSDLLMEMKKEFTEEEQLVFANSFYLYLNYHPTEDFVIDLDGVYEMIGFSKKCNAKRILENNFTENEDYKSFLLRTEEKTSQDQKVVQDNLQIWGRSKRQKDMLNEYYKAQKKSIGEKVKTDGGTGLNNQKVMLSTDTFKNLCMIARTEKAKKIRMYYIKLENIKKYVEEKTIVSSPKTVISNDIDSDLLTEMKKEFTEEEQVIFANNFYMYLNYHPTEDFVIDLGEVYEMIGFSEKRNAKRVLENNFTEKQDYLITVLPKEQDFSQIWGRLNKESIMLNTDTFKNLCMIARTEKAKKIRMYYVKLENINMKLIKNKTVLFNQDQINISKRLIEHFGSKNDVFYMFSFKYLQELYVKFGIVGELREFHKRIIEYQLEFGDICFHQVLQCSNVTKIEREFKETSLYSTNKTKIPKKSGVGSHVEIIKLSEIITSETVSQEMLRVAGDRILDPPPEYSESSSLSLQMEREKTKQIQEKTKQMEIELEMKKLGFLTREPEKQKKTREKDPEKERQKQLKKELLIEDKRIQKILQEQEKELQLKSIHKFVYDCANETMIMEDLIEIKYLYQQFQEWIQEKYNMKCLLKYKVFLKHMSGDFPLKFSKKNGGGTAWLREFVLK